MKLEGCVKVLWATLKFPGVRRVRLTPGYLARHRWWLKKSTKRAPGYSDLDSPPSIEPMAPQTPKLEAPVASTSTALLGPESTESLTNRTEPSANATPTPPECELVTVAITFPCLGMPSLPPPAQETVFGGLTVLKPTCEMLPRN